MQTIFLLLCMRVSENSWLNGRKNLVLSIPMAGFAFFGIYGSPWLYYTTQYSSQYGIWWNLFQLIIRFAFQEYSLMSNDMEVFTIIDYVTYALLLKLTEVLTVSDSFLVIDLAIRFRTMYIQRGLWCSKSDKMAKRYFFTWFLYDLLGTFPFELFFWNHTLRMT